MQKAWEVALAPAKSIPMTLFMLYMVGNSIQIFSIIITFMNIMNPIKAIMQTGGVFESFAAKEEDEDVGAGRPAAAATSSSRRTATSAAEFQAKQLVKVKIVYVLCNLLSLACGLYKMSSLGLLPTYLSDWIGSGRVGMLATPFTEKLYW